MTIDSSAVLPALPVDRADSPFAPPPELEELCTREPLARLRYPDGHLGWLATGHALGKAILADSRFSVHPLRSPVLSSHMPTGDPAFLSALDEFPERAGESMVLDPPEHSRIRRAQTAYLSVRRMEDLRASVTDIVAQQIAEMERSGPPVDIVHVSEQISARALCRLLGVPEDDRAKFQEPNRALVDPDIGVEDKVAIWREFYEYAGSVVQRKRSNPGNDLLSELVTNADLTDDEIKGIALQLFDAGHETTSFQLSLSIFALLAHPGSWKSLHDDPELVNSAVEELLRFVPISNHGAFTRTATEDVELGNVVIKAGESVTVALATANRDPRMFESPDELNLCRHALGHLSFGHGRHMCLGQHYARLQLRVALEALTQRFPTMRLAVAPEEVPIYSGERFLHGLAELLVSW